MKGIFEILKRVHEETNAVEGVWNGYSTKNCQE